MPNGNMILFYKEVKTNPKFEAQYEACNCEPEKIVKLANDSGFEFTLEELVEELGDMFCLKDLRAQVPEGGELFMPHPCLP